MEAEKFDSIVSEMLGHAVMKAEDAFYDYDSWLKLCNRLRTAHRRELENVALMQSALWHVCNSTSNGKSQDFRSDLTEWLKGLKRRINAGEMKRNCDRFNTGDIEKDAQDALEAYLEAGCCGYRAVAEYLLSPAKDGA